MSGNTHITDGQVEAAAARMRKIIEAAENSNQAGEDALIRADAAASLYKATDSLVMLCGRSGDSLTDFEEQAQRFQNDTGKMRPGKDAPVPELAATHEEFKAWVSGLIMDAQVALAKADGKQS